MNVSLELEFTQVFHATGSLPCYWKYPNTTGVDLKVAVKVPSVPELLAASVAQLSFSLLR